MLNELIGVMKKEFPRRPPSLENLYDYYMSRVKNNLHVALCFSPVRTGPSKLCRSTSQFMSKCIFFDQVGEKFRARSLKFPGLISGCTMDWFQRWPKDALIAVSNHFLSDFPIECTPTVKQAVVNTMGVFQVWFPVLRHLHWHVGLFVK